MPTLLFIVANLILLGINILGVIAHNPVIGFVTGGLYGLVAVTGQLTKNIINVGLLWITVGLAILFVLLGALAFIL